MLYMLHMHQSFCPCKIFKKTFQKVKAPWPKLSQQSLSFQRKCHSSVNQHTSDNTSCHWGLHSALWVWFPLGPDITGCWTYHNSHVGRSNCLFWWSLDPMMVIYKVVCFRLFLWFPWGNDRKQIIFLFLPALVSAIENSCLKPVAHFNKSTFCTFSDM